LLSFDLLDVGFLTLVSSSWVFYFSRQIDFHSSGSAATFHSSFPSHPTSILPSHLLHKRRIQPFASLETIVVSHCNCFCPGLYSFPHVRKDSYTRLVLEPYEEHYILHFQIEDIRRPCKVL
jgi:hypothetical protein